LSQNHQIGRDDTYGVGFVFSETATPPPFQGGVVPALPLFGVPSIYMYTLCRKITKFDVATYYVGERRVSLGHPRLPSQHSSTPNLPILGFSCIFTYTL